MATYLIGYDLNRPRSDAAYRSLHVALQDLFPQRWPVLRSVWLVDSALPISQIRSGVQPYLDPTDTLLVVRLEGSWAGTGMSRKALAWLLEHLGP